MTKQLDWVDQQRVVDAIVTADGENHFRHEGGLYMKYDELEVDYANHRVLFAYKGEKVAVMDQINVNPPDVLTVQGLFGGIKVEINTK